MPQWTVQSRHQSPRAPWRRRQVASPPGGGGGGEVAGITHAHVGGFPGAAPPVPKKEASPRPQRIATARGLASTRRPLLSAPCLSGGQPAPRCRTHRSLDRPAHHILQSRHLTNPATLPHEFCNRRAPLRLAIFVGSLSPFFRSPRAASRGPRSEEHTSHLQSLLHIS